MLANASGSANPPGLAIVEEHGSAPNHERLGVAITPKHEALILPTRHGPLYGQHAPSNSSQTPLKWDSIQRTT